MRLLPIIPLLFFSGCHDEEHAIKADENPKREITFDLEEEAQPIIKAYSEYMGTVSDQSDRFFKLVSKSKDLEGEKAKRVRELMRIFIRSYPETFTEDKEWIDMLRNDKELSFLARAINNPSLDNEKRTQKELIAAREDYLKEIQTHIEGVFAKARPSHSEALEDLEKLLESE